MLKKAYAPQVPSIQALMGSMHFTDTPIGQLVDQYRQEHPEIVAQLEAMVAELSKLTVLLHEECHAALTDIQVSTLSLLTTSCDDILHVRRPFHVN